MDALAADVPRAAEPVWAVGYRHGPAAVDVCGNDPADLEYLSEFLEPLCQVVPAGSGTLRVRVLASAPMARDLECAWDEMRLSSRRVAAIPCVKLDTRIIAFDGWREDGRLTLVDPVTGCFFLLSDGSVDIVCRRGDDGTRLGLLGLVREAIVGAASAAIPILDLHAASFALGGRAVLVAGGKRSGKTSTLCRALGSAGAAFISNDRTFVELDGPMPAAVGIPTVVSVRADTLKAFPQLGLRADAYPPLTPIAPPTAPDGDGDPGDRALLLSPARFAGRLGVPRVGRAPLSAIVLPEVSAHRRGWTVERLPAGVAAARLEACLYGAAAGRDQPTLFGGLAQVAGPAPPPIGVRLDRVVSAVPVFAWRLGPDAYGNPVSEVLEAIGVEGPR